MYYCNKSRILWHSNFTNCRSVKILITWFYRINHPALAVRLGLRVMKIIFSPYQSDFFRFCPPPTLFAMLSIWLWGNKPSTLKVILSKLGRNQAAPFPRVYQPYSWSATESPLSQSNKRSLAMHVCPSIFLTTVHPIDFPIQLLPTSSSSMWENCWGPKKVHCQVVWMSGSLESCKQQYRKPKQSACFARGKFWIGTFWVQLNSITTLIKEGCCRGFLYPFNHSVYDQIFH